MPVTRSVGTIAGKLLLVRVVTLLGLFLPCLSLVSLYESLSLVFWEGTWRRVVVIVFGGEYYDRFLSVELGLLSLNQVWSLFSLMALSDLMSYHGAR